MSLNSLKIATDGYLKRQTKAVLIIAVAGYLNFSSTPPTPSSGGHSGGFKHQTELSSENRYKDKIIKEDEEMILVIKKYMDYRNKN